MTTAQVLTAEKSFEIGLPIGGSAGQVPVKQSTTDYDTAWTDIATQVELDAAINALHTNEFDTSGDIFARLGGGTKVGIGALGPSGEAGVKFATDTRLYRRAGGELRTDGHFEADLDLIARFGAAQHIQIGAQGPAGEAGMAIGLGFDVRLYRNAAGELRTNAYVESDSEFIGRIGTAAESRLGGRGPAGQAGVSFGVGGGDTNLYRQAASYLRSDGSLQLGGEFYIDLGGFGNKMFFGSGADVNLYRSAADVLKTDDYFHSANEIAARIGQSGQVNLGATGPSSQAGIMFGNGGDVNLYRQSAGELKTDGYFEVGLDIDARRSVAEWVRIGATGPASQAGIVFGSAFDTNLYRASANILQTDDDFVSASYIVAAEGNAGRTAIGYVGPGFEAGIRLGSAGDVNLYRSAADSLKTDDTLITALNLYAASGSAAQTIVGGAGPSGQSGMQFGSAGDTNLYRGSVDELRSDDSLTIRTGFLTQMRLGDMIGSSQPGILFGSASDTNLYRSAAGVLKTDNYLKIANTKEIRFGDTADADGGRIGVSASNALYIQQANLQPLNFIMGSTLKLAIPAVGSADEDGLRFGSLGDTNLYRAGADILATQDDFYANAGGSSQIGMINNAGRGELRFGVAQDTNLYRSAADSLKTDDSLNVGGIFNVGSNGFELNPGGWIISRRTDGGAFISMGEQSADPTAFADHARIFSRDNGSGKTQLCVRFGTGAVQVLATEP